MKTFPYILQLSVLFATLSGLTPSGKAAIVVCDTFDQDPFTVELFGNAHDSAVDLPMTNRRYVSLNGRPGLITSGATMTVSNDVASQKLTLAISGEHLSTNPWVFLDLDITYISASPRSLIGYSGFVFQFSNIIGADALIVNLGGGKDIYDETTPRLALNGPGEYFVPLEEMSIAPGSTVEQYNFIHFIFEAHSPEFAMTLDEIRLVPETGTAGLLFGAGLWSLRRNASRRPRTA